MNLFFLKLTENFRQDTIDNFGKVLFYLTINVFFLALTLKKTEYLIDL